LKLDSSFKEGINYMRNKLLSGFIAILWILASAGISASDTAYTPRFNRFKPVPELHEYIVADRVTGLYWQGCVAGLKMDYCLVGTAETYTLDGAQNYCANLHWAGFESGWRLPNVKELSSIVNRKEISPSIDKNVFLETPSNYFWSSTIYSGYTDFAFYVEFNEGFVGYEDKSSNSYNVRCVRDGL